MNLNSKRLFNQIVDAFGSVRIDEEVFTAATQAGPMVNPESVETMLMISQSLPDFFMNVDTTYSQLESRLEITSRNLAASSEELYQTVDDLQKLNSTLDALINSLNQGFLLFDRSGIVQGIYSRKCEEIFSRVPIGLHLSDLLSLSEQEHEAVKMWIDQVFVSQMDFLDIANLGPAEFNHPNQRKIELSYQPVYGKDKALVFVVLIATDRTVEYEARLKFEKMSSYVSRITALINQRKDVENQQDQMLKLMGRIEEILKNPGKEFREESLRLLHTAKSLAAIMKATEVRDQIHRAEEVLRFSDDAEFIMSLHDFLIKIKESLNHVLIETSQFIEKMGQSSSESISVEKAKNFKEKIHEKETWTPSEIMQVFGQEFLMNPMSSFIRSYEDHAKLLSEQYGKKIEPFTIVGDFLVYYPKWADLIGSLSHIFSNIVIHGIEAPTTRMGAGKSEWGRILVSLAQTETQYNFIIEDNGGGINVQKVRTKAEQLKLLRPHQSYTNDEICYFIFEDQFSTQDLVDENAGRGVGMSAVKREVEELGGHIRVESKQGHFTRFLFEIPRTKPVQQALSSPHQK